MNLLQERVEAAVVEFGRTGGSAAGRRAAARTLEESRSGSAGPGHPEITPRSGLLKAAGRLMEAAAHSAEGTEEGRWTAVGLLAQAEDELLASGAPGADDIRTARLHLMDQALPSASVARLAGAGCALAVAGSAA